MLLISLAATGTWFMPKNLRGNVLYR